jgi:polygalacturonase
MLPKKEYVELPNYDRQNFISSAGSALRDIKIIGGGKIRSNDGWSWWPRKLTGEFRPHLLSLGSVTNVLIQNIYFEDSPNHNIEVSNCTTVRVDRLFVNAPQISPNTDGINFYGGRDQSLTNSIIANGDDCVSVVNLGEADVDCQNNPLLLKCRGGNVHVKNVTCLGGHGISIGGMRNGTISNVTFENMTATGGTTQGVYSSGGLRVKSYPDGVGYAYDIVYKDIILDGVYLPIQLLGRYCPWPSKCPPSKTSVQFLNISFINIRGTSRELETVGVISCSKVAPCKNIFLENVVLKSKLKDAKNSKFTCENIENITFSGDSYPQACQKQ